MTNSTSPQSNDQYSLAKILGIWAAAAVPMGILGMVVYPALTPDRVADPLKAGSTRLILLTAGLVWQFVLAMLIVYREEGDLRCWIPRRANPGASCGCGRSPFPSWPLPRRSSLARS